MIVNPESGRADFRKKARHGKEISMNKEKLIALGLSEEVVEKVLSYYKESIEINSRRR